MVSLMANQVISHQAYSAHFNRRRLIGIEEDDEAITHYVNFHLDEHRVLIARVEHRLENSQIPGIIIVKEDKIRFRDKARLPHDVPLSELPEREEIISKIAQRIVVIVGIEIDQKFYARLNNGSKSIKSLENNTYILIAPETAQQKPKTPLKEPAPCDFPSSEESEDSQQSRSECFEEEQSPVLPPQVKLQLSLTPEADL
jgi:hypothetical protein